MKTVGLKSVTRSVAENALVSPLYILFSWLPPSPSIPATVLFENYPVWHRSTGFIWPKEEGERRKKRSYLSKNLKLRASRHKLEPRGFQLDVIKKTVFSLKVVKRWHRDLHPWRCTEVEWARPWSPISAAILGRGFRPDDLKRPLPT